MIDDDFVREPNVAMFVQFECMHDFFLSNLVAYDVYKKKMLLIWNVVIIWSWAAQSLYALCIIKCMKRAGTLTLDFISHLIRANILNFLLCKEFLACVNRSARTVCVMNMYYDDFEKLYIEFQADMSSIFPVVLYVWIVFFWKWVIIRNYLFDRCCRVCYETYKTMLQFVIK